MSKGTAQGSPDGPRYIYGKENINWSGPKRASEPNHEENLTIFGHDEMLKEQRAARVAEKTELFEDIMHDLTGIGLNDWDDTVQFHPSQWGGDGYKQMREKNPEQWENRMVRDDVNHHQPRMNNTLHSPVFSYKDEKGNPIVSSNMDFLASLSEEEYNDRAEKYEKYLEYRKEENKRQSVQQKEDAKIIEQYNKDNTKKRVRPGNDRVYKFDPRDFPNDNYDQSESFDLKSLSNHTERDNAIRKQVAADAIESNLGSDVMKDNDITRDDIERVIDRLQKTNPRTPRWEFERRSGFANEKKSLIDINYDDGYAFYNNDNVNMKKMMKSLYTECHHDMSVYNSKHPGEIDLKEFEKHSTDVKQSDFFEQARFLKQYSTFLNDNGIIDESIK